MNIEKKWYTLDEINKLHGRLCDSGLGVDLADRIACNTYHKEGVYGDEMLSRAALYGVRENVESTMVCMAEDTEQYDEQDV